ncbi:MAG: hypothetical protein AAGN35_19810 [Bacteroidota bacterium]
MKKYSVLFVLLLMFSFAAKAQGAGEGSYKSPLGGNEAKCLMISLEAQEKNVAEVMKQKFKKLKHSSSKGWDAFTAQIFPEISSQTLDIYYRVEGGKKDQVTVYLAMSTGYDNWLTAQDHSNELNNAKTMLEGLIKEVKVYELGLAIAAQTKVVEEAVKEQEKLTKENEKLGKDLEKLQKEIEDNKADTEQNLKDQEAQKKTIEDQKKALDELQKELGSVK